LIHSELTLRPDRLAASIDRVANDPVMARRTEALGAAIRSEKGIQRAVAQIETVLAA
jgi:UDP:flavonoid glycosyltransferase YjiC (YdhE family)